MFTRSDNGFGVDVAAHGDGGALITQDRHGLGVELAASGKISDSFLVFMHLLFIYMV